MKGVAAITSIDLKREEMAVILWAEQNMIPFVTYGRDELLQYLVNTSDRSWSGVIRQGFAFSIEKKQSGGTLGILLAFPFWNLVGTVLGAVVVFLLLLVCVLLIFNLTPGRIRDLATGKIVIRWGRKPKDVEEQEQRQISFQQEQQRQMMAQQAYILQQQQAAAQSGRMRAASRRPLSGMSRPAEGSIKICCYRRA